MSVSCWRLFATAGSQRLEVPNAGTERSGIGFSRRVQEATLVCPKCNAALAGVGRFCSNCGVLIEEVQTATSTAKRKISGKAIVSLGLSILSIFPFSLIAVILGHQSLSEIRGSAGRLKGRGLAIAALILGYVGTILQISLLLLRFVAPLFW